MPRGSETVVYLKTRAEQEFELRKQEMQLKKEELEIQRKQKSKCHLNKIKSAAIGSTKPINDGHDETIHEQYKLRLYILYIMNSTKQLYLFSLDVFIYIRVVVVFMMNVSKDICVFCV